MHAEPIGRTASVRSSSALERTAMPDEGPQERKRPRRADESTPTSESGKETVRRGGGRDMRTPYGYLEPSVTGSPVRDSLAGIFPKKLNLGFESLAEANGVASCPGGDRAEVFRLHGTTLTLIEDALVKVFDRLDMIDLQRANSTCRFWRKLIDHSKELRPKLPTHVPMSRNFIELYRIEQLQRFAHGKDAAKVGSAMNADKGRQRKILIDWLVDVQTHFTMCQETLHNTVSLVDRVWAVHRDLPPRRIQAMGAACLFISAKFNETYSIPSLPDMAWVCDFTYTKEALVEMEIEVLQLLGFNVRAIAPVSFIGACFKSLVGANDLDYEQAFALASYHADLFLVQSESVGVDAALVGAAAVVSAFFTLRTSVIPLKPVCYLCRVPERKVRALVCRMQTLHALDFENASAAREEGPARLHAIYERYSGDLVPTRPASVVPRAPVVVHCECAMASAGKCWWCESPECAARHGTTQAEVEVVMSQAPGWCCH
mmetsp:Transcript_61968/g.147638  ORF Transcript_61968/g.147638 Transcript_61968/m.147638 type:complete len:488 (-) Transcript_61968:86-1549(-)